MDKLQFLSIKLFHLGFVLFAVIVRKVYFLNLDAKNCNLLSFGNVYVHGCRIRICKS